MKNLFKIACCALVVLMSASCINAKEKGLKDAYKKYFTVGCAVNMRNITTPEQMDLIKLEFNSITAENDMKPQPTHPEEGTWNWENADKIANFARENKIGLRGHCLIWHSQVGRWMFYDDKGELVSKEVLFERMKQHIFTVVNRYKDVAYAWDVVNEAMTDDANAEIPYRQSLFYQIAGDEFIKKAFEYAHEADPKALLFYNDYNETDPVKRDRIYNMVKSMKAEGVPIDGIGMQGHYNVYSPSEADFDAALTKYSEIVDHINVTELDVRVNREMGGQLRFSQGESTVSDEAKAKQTEMYDMLFRVLRKHKKYVDNVTFWNLGDRDSWLGVRNYPLVFDENYQRKPAYDKIANFK